uniref:Uncharacterized protein n=1 Tax=Trichuris muris TaxID=70415 RepID=A0A5S6QGJ0_TRIMR
MDSSVNSNDSKQLEVEHMLCVSNEVNHRSSDQAKTENMYTALPVAVSSNNTLNHAPLSLNQVNSIENPDETTSVLVGSHRQLKKLEEYIFNLEQRKKQSHLRLLSKMAALKQMETNMKILLDQQHKLADAQKVYQNLEYLNGSNGEKSKLVKRTYAKSQENLAAKIEKLHLRIIQATAAVGVLESSLESQESLMKSKQEELLALRTATRAKEESLMRKVEDRKQVQKIKQETEKRKLNLKMKQQKKISQATIESVFGKNANEQGKAAITFSPSTEPQTEEKVVAEKPSRFEELQRKSGAQVISSRSSMIDKLLNAIITQDGSTDCLYDCQIADASVQPKNVLPHAGTLLCKSSCVQLNTLTCPFYVVKMASFEGTRYTFSAIDANDEVVDVEDTCIGDSEILESSEEQSQAVEDSYDSFSGLFVRTKRLDLCHKNAKSKTMGICYDMNLDSGHSLRKMQMDMQARPILYPVTMKAVKRMKLSSKKCVEFKPDVGGKEEAKQQTRLQEVVFKVPHSFEKHSTTENDRKRLHP